MAANIDPEQVIARLSQQIGALSAQLAMTNVALDAAEARIAELEGVKDPAP
jgi:hypothetical protein